MPGEPAYKRRWTVLVSSMDAWRGKGEGGGGGGGGGGVGANRALRGVTLGPGEI